MNTQRGSDSYLLFALNKDNAPDTPIDDLSDVDKLVYNIVSADLARDTEVVRIEESSASGNPQVPEAARIRTQGNVVFNLRGRNMQRILQHALWTRTPTQRLSSQKKQLYHGAYTDGTAVSIATGFSEVGLAKVSVTLEGSGFATGKTSGNVEVVGTDKDGEAQTVTLAFSAATGTEKSTELFATVTSFTVNDITGGTVSLSVDNEKSAGALAVTTKELLSAQAYTTGEAVEIDTQLGEALEPAKAVVTLADSSLVAVGNSVSVKVIGTDMDDLEISDTVVFSGNTGTARSSEYFKTITSLIVIGVQGGTVSLSVDNERKEVVFKPGRSPLFATLELNRGAAAPIVFDRVIATGFSVAVSGSNGSVRLTVDYAGRTTRKKTLEGAAREDVGLHGLPVAFKEVNDSVFIAYGTVVTFDGVVLPIRDMTLTVDNNYDVQGYLTGEREYATPEQNERVSAVLSGTVKYAYDESYSDTFIQNRFVEDFSLKCLRAPSGKPKDEMEFRFGRGKLSADPDRVAVTQGVVEQTIEISLLGSEGATVADYLTLFVRSSEGLYGDVFG